MRQTDLIHTWSLQHVHMTCRRRVVLRTSSMALCGLSSAPAKRSSFPRAGRMPSSPQPTPSSWAATSCTASRSSALPFTQAPLHASLDEKRHSPSQLHWRCKRSILPPQAVCPVDRSTRNLVSSFAEKSQTVRISTKSLDSGRPGAKIAGAIIESYIRVLCWL